MAGMFDKVREKGEERLGALTSDWLGNERFMAAVEAALSTKGFLERQLKKVLHTMSVASRLDVDELQAKLAESERKLRQLQKRFEALQRQVEEASDSRSREPAAPAGPPATAAQHAAAAHEPAPGISTAAGQATAEAEAAPASMEAVCASCGKTFHKKSYNQRYCSVACRSGV